MWPRDHTPPLIQSLVLYAGTPAAATSGSAEKQSHRGALPLCDASRFQLTQFGSPWLAVYESVYWRRGRMVSSLGFASVGGPSSALGPVRAPGDGGSTAALSVAGPMGPPPLAGAVSGTWPGWGPA